MEHFYASSALFITKKNFLYSVNLFFLFEKVFTCENIYQGATPYILVAHSKLYVVLNTPKS